MLLVFLHGIGPTTLEDNVTNWGGAVVSRETHGESTYMFLHKTNTVDLNNVGNEV